MVSPACRVDFLDPVTVKGLSTRVDGTSVATSHRWAVRVIGRPVAPLSMAPPPATDADGRTPRVRPHPPGGRHRRAAAGAPQGRPRVGRTATVLVVAGVAAAVALTPLATASATMPVPQPTVKLPATAEALAPYVPQDSCDPVAKPGVIAFRALMLATYKRGTDGGIVRACDDGGTSEHKEGRAWDWMLDVHDAGDAAVASGVLQFLLAPGPHQGTLSPVPA